MTTKILKKAKNSTISSLFAGIVVIMAMFITVACEKDETSVADQQQTVRKPQPISDMEVMQYLPEVVDGRLVFKDEASFRKVRAWIGENQLNPEKVINTLNYDGFVSMKNVFIDGLRILISNNDTEDDIKVKYEEYQEFVSNHPNVFKKCGYSDDVIYELQSSNSISYIANEFGVYQVDEKIYRTSFDREYILLNNNEENLIAIINDNGTLKSSEQILVNVFNDDLLSKELNSEYIEDTLDGDPKKRFKVCFYSALNSGQWDYDVRVIGQKKTLGVWLNTLSLHTTCSMDKLNSYWKVSGVTYNWDDAVAWAYTFGWDADFRFTAITTPSSTPISFSLSYMPYEVKCKITANGEYTIWNRSNIMITGQGWNN